MFSRYFWVLPISFIGLERTETSNAEQCNNREETEFAKPDADNKIHVRKYLIIFNLPDKS